MAVATTSHTKNDVAEDCGLAAAKVKDYSHAMAGQDVLTFDIGPAGRTPSKGWLIKGKSAVNLEIG